MKYFRVEIVGTLRHLTKRQSETSGMAFTMHSLQVYVVNLPAEDSLEANSTSISSADEDPTCDPHRIILSVPYEHG